MSDFFLKIIEGDVLDALKTLPDESVNLIVTSPPYWGLRDYGVEGQIGLEPTLDEYLDKMLKVTAELKRVLRKDGILFWNHGDSYSGNMGKRSGWSYVSGLGNKKDGTAIRFKGKYKLPQKCMTMQNYRLAIRMVDEQGWILRNVIIWHKPNHMPSSAKDRFTNAYEPVFFFVKSKKYWSDLDAVREPHKYPNDNRPGKTLYAPNEFNVAGGGKGRLNQYKNPLWKNPGDVWGIPTQPFSARKLGIEDVDHFATFPEELVRRIIKFGCPKWICKKCGKPRERIIKKNYIPTRPGKNVGKGKSGRDDDPNKSLHRRDISKYRMKIEYYTVDWADCGCNAGWRPGVVLDPFMGSGTTLKVARELGCSAVGIELNPDYVRIAKKRVNWGIGLDVEFIYERV